MDLSKITIKSIIKYIIILIFFLLCLILFNNRDTDIIWNYGIAHAIRIGEIPYKDFNIITTPLYAFIMSSLLFIKDSYLIYLLEQSIICTLFIFIVEKLINKKYIIILLWLCFPYFVLISPNYNFLVLLLYVLLMYLEKYNKKDSIIGLILGLLLLTKHTIGIVTLLFSIISTFNINKGIKRFIYSLIPVLVFIIYLVLTNSYKSFIDLSILGLFDFGKSNNTTSLITLLLVIPVVIYTIYSLFKYKKDINNFYLISSISIIIPMIDLYHTHAYILIFLIIFLDRIKINNKYLLYIPNLFILLLFIFNIIININQYKNLSSNDLDKFKYYLLDKEEKIYVDNIINEYKSYKNSYMLSMNSMFFDIETNHKITYLDIPLYGNYGYDGINKMKKRISKLKDSYMFIQESNNKQYAIEINNYIRNNYKLIEKYYNFEIYYIK